jgi:hypothetical protein
MTKNRLLLIFKATLVVSAILFFYVDCKNYPDTTNVCFETEVLPIFQSNCAMSGCHSSSHGKSEVVLDNYDNIIKSGINKGNAKTSKVYKTLTRTFNRMPPSGPLTGTQIALIYSWIQTGAENTTGCGANLTTCDTVNVKYSTNIITILDGSCLGCHGIGSEPDMSSYNSLRSYLVTNSQTFLNDINYVTEANPMPPTNKLSDCYLKQIHVWIQAGYPNN